MNGHADRREWLVPALRAVQLAVAALFVAAAGLVLASGAEAQTSASTTTTTAASNPNTYDLSALANALDIVLGVPNLPLGLVVEAGPYGASANLNSLGQSLADAGAPYSPTLSTLPGTINGLGSGSVPPLPPLPGYVAASYPGKPDNDQTQGGYALSSSASAADAKGSADMGVQPAGSANDTMSATAEAKANSDGSVQVSAAAGLDALSFGSLFDIANVSSSISMTQQANGQPSVTSTTNLGTITLLGLPSGLSAGGVGVLGVNVPIDLSNEVIGLLNSMLSSEGVTFTYLPETFEYTDGTSSSGSTPDTSKTLQAIDSGALEISVAQNVPGQGMLHSTYTLGRVYVSTSDGPGIGSVTGNSGSVGNTGNTGGSVAVPSTAGSTVAPPALSGYSSSGVAGVTPTTTGTAAPPAGSHALAFSPTYAIEMGPSAESLYLVLLLVALAVLLGSQAVRFFAVKMALTGQRVT